VSGPHEIPNLHDAVLERIEVSWDEGLARIGLTLVPGGPLVLTAVGLRAFSMSRRQDWGPSVYVNGAQVRTGGEDPIVVEIEMQSGDVITVAAERIDSTQP
jgi:hypothetical protein